MANLIVNRLTNANIYLEGVSLLGRGEEIDLPQPKAVMVEHKGLGMFGKPEFPAGIDKLETRVKWASFYPEVLPSIFNPRQSISVMVRGDLETWNSAGLNSELPVVAFMTVLFKDAPTFKFKKQENVDFESTGAVYYYKLTVAGVDQVEIDVLANIYNVMGEDILAAYRLNIGA
jgi:P2 family phage contractile tail tube protein